LAAAAHTVLDVAYTTLWTIRGNVPGWRALRSQLGPQLDSIFGVPAGTHSNWIAVSGFDDTPHRPVNVPTAPYPQFDIPAFNVTKTDLVTNISVTTRYMVASAGTFIGPNDPTMSSFTDPDPGILQPPPPSPVSAQPPFSPSPAPRTIPQDQPVIPAGNQVIIYIHGGGSRAEEAVGLANWLIVEGAALGQNYTVVSLDLPNSAYGTSFDVTDILVGHAYDNNLLEVRDFEQRYIIAFIQALQGQLGITDEQIVAVMGGSLGGNMGLLLSSQNASHAFLDTIVAWSATSLAPSTTFDISNSFVAAYLGGLKAAVTSPEPPTNHAIESTYIDNMYNKPLISDPLLPFVPPQPLMWYRSPTPPAPEPAEPQWAPCKSSLIAQSRFDRYEIYSPTMRHWATAVDLELITFSFQDNCLYQQISASPTSHLFLAAGDRDNYDPVDIFNSTITVAQMLRHDVHGKAEFWKDTGHSFHDERPHLFAKEIVFFLNNLDADTSPNGTVTNALQPTIASDTSH
jgi:pimeloyl-ACP methyl ester carboxylesterase